MVSRSRAVAAVHAGAVPDQMRHLDRRSETYIRARPPGSSASSTEQNLAHSILRGLGHRDVTLGQMALTSVTPHLAGHRIRHLVLSGTQHVPGNLLDCLTQMCASIGARLWCLYDTALAYDHPRVDLVPYGDLAEAFGHRPAVVEHCDAPWCQPLYEDLTQSASSPEFPPVPSDDAPTFLLAVKELLDPADADTVRSAVLAAAADSRRYVPQMDTSEIARGGARPRPHQVAVHTIRRVAHNARTADEALAGVRGVQLAMAAAHVIVSVETDRFLATWEATAHQRPAYIGSSRWHLLTRYRQPAIGATVALTVAGLSLSDMLNLRPENVTDGEIILGWKRYAIPLGGRIFIRTQLELAADAGSPTVLTSADGQPAALGQLRGWLSRPASELGVDIIGRPRAWSGQEEALWLRQHGIYVQWGRAITGIRAVRRISHGHFGDGAA